ncbi:MAG: hypothetical protein C6I01_06915 [Epsilonproteobacteria bacterium]|jgi:hypothetical protein|nr:hypothetical protein [Campylobacterota bacterium]NPA89167.1 hypothetical protein [Campylobacterota bacterium]
MRKWVLLLITGALLWGGEKPMPKPPNLPKPQAKKPEKIKPPSPEEREIEELSKKVTKLLNYNFKLENFNRMKTPFWTPPVKVDIKPKKPVIQTRYSFEVLAILDDSAKLKVLKYRGDQLVNVEKKWFKRGEPVATCILWRVFDDGVTLKCGKKMITKRLFNQFPIKVK